MFHKKDKTSQFEEGLHEIEQILDKFNEDGKTDREYSEFSFMAARLLQIDLTLHRISLVLIGLFSFIVGEFLTKVF